MANSLQDQLLKTGLVTEQQLEQAREPPPRPPKGRGKGARGNGRATGSEGQPERRARGDGRDGSGAARRRTPRGTEKRREAPPCAPVLRPSQNKKIMRRRVRAYLEEHELNTEDGSVPYNFLRGTRIKRLYVTEAQRVRLLAGELLIAEVYSTHHILEPPLLPPLLKLLPDTFVHRHEPGTAEAAPAAGAEEGAEEGAYAGHEVPDDLIW